jgi:hypothetical protein
MGGVRQATTVPFEDGPGALAFTAVGAWRLRVRTVVLTAGSGRRRRLVTARRLRQFAVALDARALPVAVPGTGATIVADPTTTLPYGVLRAPRGGGRVALSSVAAAARSAAES